MKGADLEPAELLQELEARLMDPAVRTDAARVDALLTDDFMEIGSSGRTFNKRETIADLGSERSWEPPVVGEFSVAMLSAEIGLVTYRTSRQESGDVLRTSIWVLRDGRWQVRFHQGTRTP